jgi:hypothetical protein
MASIVENVVNFWVHVIVTSVHWYPLSFCLKCRNEDRFAWWPRDVNSSCRARPLADKTGTGSEVSEQSKSGEVHGVFRPHTKRTEAGRPMYRQLSRWHEALSCEPGFCASGLNVAVEWVSLLPPVMEVPDSTSRQMSARMVQLSYHMLLCNELQTGKER